MQKVERKRVSRLWSDRAYRRKRSWVERRKPEGRGEREKQQEGLAPSGRFSFYTNKGPSWIGRPFGNKVLALFYFPT